MEELYCVIDELIDYAEKNLMLDKRNEDYAKNAIFNLLNLDSYTPSNTVCTEKTPESVLKRFADLCVKEGVFEDCEREKYCDAVMGALALSPKAVEDIFYILEKKKGGKTATQWFYDYSVKCDYVKKAKLDANPRFESHGLIVTINKAKPEFRDAKKAADGNKPKGGYPACNICHSNEGFSGRSKCTLRTVNLTMGGEPWFWQFSPYGYFYQHGIAVNYKHTPMHVDRDTFIKLMDFVDRFPHYFIGSNAALPRIGGSVLAHDHYQGGGETLPLQTAKTVKSFKANGFKSVSVELLDWPGTAFRLVSKNKKALVEVADRVNKYWCNYENKDLGIIPFGDDGRRHAISPTVIKKGSSYEMIIILRSNITSEQYPDGVFHAHPEFHIIKKESIGLIEAQGLFILPGRLEAQLEEIKNLIEEEKPLTEELKDFQMIFDEIKKIAGSDLTEENLDRAVKEELGSVCYRILENTAVFKNNSQLEEFLKQAQVI